MEMYAKREGAFIFCGKFFKAAYTTIYNRASAMMYVKCNVQTLYCIYIILYISYIIIYIIHIQTNNTDTDTQTRPPSLPSLTSLPLMNILQSSIKSGWL